MSPFRLFPSLPLEPIGHRRDGRPIYPVLGGAAAADDVEDETDEEAEDEEDSGADPGKNGKYEPPSRAEWLKVQGALSRANASAKQRRELLAERDAELQKLRDEMAAADAEAERKTLLDGQQPAGRKGKKGGGGGPTPAATLPDGVLTKSQVRQLTAQAAREAKEQTVAEFRDILVNQAAASALTRAGAQVDNVERLVRLLELDDVQLGDKGEIEGLDDQVESLKAELPQLFRAAEDPKPRKRAPAPRAQASGRPDPQPQRLSSAEQIAQMALGNRV